jgi:uncharacterized protein YjdB
VRKSKKISSAILLVFLITLFGAFSASAADLSDIKGHWAENEIKAMVSQGIVTGYTDNTFKPGNAISRAEFITIINRAFGFEESAEISYTDVKPGDWFAPQIQKARAAGYIAGYEDNTMRPNNKISRQEVAVIIGRILNLDNNAGLTEVDRFSDAASIPSWSRGAVGAVVAAGYMTGYPDGSFKAGNNITRAEAVVVVGRCLVEEIFSQAGTYGPATGSQTIDGNAVISVSGVTLQNMVINGDLTIASTVGEGNFTLKNVTVKGTTYVNGGGADSGILDGFQGQIVVNKHGVRLIATGATSVSTTTLNTFARLEEPATLTGTGFYNLVLTGSIPAGTTIVISGDFNNVVVNAPGVIVKIESGSKVASLEVNQSASITGTGTISTATVNAANVTIAQTPNKTIVAEGLTAMVGGKEVSGTYTKPTGGGGGGGGKTVAVTGIILSPATLQLNLGQSSTLTAIITPSNATNKNITWTSDHPGAVTVNNGVVTAVGKGSATITATTEDGGKTATCVVTVVVPVTGVSLSKTSLNMVAGGHTATLVPLITPADADNNNVTWASLDESVATVDASGVVTPIAAGITSITVTTVDGSHTASCTVTVGATPVSVDGISLNYSTYELKVGDSDLVLIPFITPADATNVNVNWTSDKNEVATVDNGTVTAVGPGEATITATTVDGGFSDTCVIKVVTPVSGITLDKGHIGNKDLGDAEVAVGDPDVNLEATIDPASADNKQVVWTTDNPAIATFIEDAPGALTGKVRFIGAGTATITATTVDGGYAASCIVTVGVRVASVVLSPTTGTLGVGGSTITLTPTASPAAATNQSVTWTSSDDTIATVNAGVVSPVADGTVTITATPVFGLPGATPGTSTIDVFNVTKGTMIKDDTLLQGKTVVSVSFTIDGPALPLNSIGVTLNDGTVLQYHSNTGGVYTYTGSTNSTKANVTSATVKIRNTASFNLGF